MIGGVQIYSSDIYSISSIQEHNLGALGMDEYGDLYRYAKAGASNISAGKLQLAPADKTNHANCAATAAVTADGRTRKVTIQLGATAATLNEYAGGYLAASNNSPEGEIYRVYSNPAASSSGTLEVTVQRPFVTDITTSSDFTLYHNAWNGVIEGTSSTAQPAGVPVVDITAAYYGWIKTRGIVAGLADETLTLGALLTAGTSTAGAFEEYDDDTTPDTDNIVGFAVVAGVDTDFRPIQLTID